MDVCDHIDKCIPCSFVEQTISDSDSDSDVMRIYQHIDGLVQYLAIKLSHRYAMICAYV